MTTLTPEISTPGNASLPGGKSMLRLQVLGFTTTASALTGAYIVIALLIYEFRIRNSSKNPKLKTNRASKERYAALMRVSAIAAASIGTTTFTSQVFQIFLDLVEDIRFCDALIKIDFTLTNFIFIAVYALLWLRQRSFYVNPSTRHLTSCYTRALSLMTLVLMFVIALINPAVFDSTQWFARTRYGCKLESSAFPPQYHWGALAVITLAFHLILLALFVYPLVRHRSALKSKSQESRPMNRKTAGLLSVIRRAFYLALVCVISDLIVVAVNVAVVTEINIVPQIVADANLLLNIFCIILTFVDWRERLFPCMKLGSTAAAGMQSRRDTTMTATSSREKVSHVTPDPSQDEQMSMNDKQISV